jgi:hypothetical protein
MVSVLIGVNLERNWTCRGVGSRWRPTVVTIDDDDNNSNLLFFCTTFLFLLSLQDEDGGPEGRKVVVKHFVQLLAQWMELFPYDFRDDNGMMMSNVRAITQKCVAVDPNVIDTTDSVYNFTSGRMLLLIEAKNKSHLLIVTIRHRPPSQTDFDTP